MLPYDIVTEMGEINDDSDDAVVVVLVIGANERTPGNQSPGLVVLNA